MNIRHILLLGLIPMLASSCGDFLEEYSQDHDYVRTWNDLNELLIGDCYMVDNTPGYFNTESNYGMFLHVVGDEIQEQVEGATTDVSFDQHEYMFGYLTWAQRTGTNQDYTTFYTENNTWTKMYKYINVANNILESAEKVPVELESDVAGVNYVKGQAHFLRAFYYFWLTNTYGQPYSPATASSALGVPVKVEPEVKDVKFTRNSVKDCYELMVSDLLSAEKELTAASSVNRKSIYRADSVSVQLLLSRVYLYMQQWDKAALYAKKVIRVHPALQNLNSDNSAFSALDNPETIFSMGGDDIIKWMSNYKQCVRVSDEAYEMYADNDLRKQQWFWNYSSFHGLTKQAPGNQANPTEESAYYHAKYNLKYDKAEVSSLFWLRSGEAYLNLAEAEAYMGNEDEARAAVNKLRTARYYSGAADTDIQSTGSQLVSDIRNERRRDLLLEGHRWFDLRRYRVCAVQPYKKSITHTYTYYRERGSADIIETRQYVLTEDDPSWTLPIPHEVLTFNVGMQGNGNLYREYTIVKTPN